MLVLTVACGGGHKGGPSTTTTTPTTTPSTSVAPSTAPGGGGEPKGPTPEEQEEVHNAYMRSEPEVAPPADPLAIPPAQREGGLEAQRALPPALDADGQARPGGGGSKLNVPAGVRPNGPVPVMSPIPPE